MPDAPANIAAGPPFGFSDTYRQLPARFHVRLDPQPVAAPRLLLFNEALADELGLSLRGASPTLLAGLFSGNVLPGDAQPIAAAYAGHQFGHFVPQLGDGRAILLGEVVDRTGVRRDIQLKGAGRTPFSRGGDGRAALGPVLREYLFSEAMQALGVPTTRALAAVGTGEPVVRDRVLPGAVLTRVAQSHIRVGTFQYFAARGDMEGVGLLVAHALVRHYPEAAASREPALALLRSVVAAQALLVAHWMSLGFVHGVMNTDNTTISGETIDYGPCAFLDAYDPQAVFSSIDQGGRYAFANQPVIAQWNLARLAETLLGLIAPEDPQAAIVPAQEALAEFAPAFTTAWLSRMRAKIGLQVSEDGDRGLVEGLLAAMAEGRADYTLTFRRLCAAAEDADALPRVAALFETPGRFAPWAEQWRQRLAREQLAPAALAAAMRRVNPSVIPRNHAVEAVLTQAVETGDLGPFLSLHAALAAPFADAAAGEPAAEPRPSGLTPHRTFCGT